MNSNELTDITWDKSKIDVSDIYDMEYWSTLWGIPKEKITEAVKQSGSNEIRILEELLCRNLPAFK